MLAIGVNGGLVMLEHLSQQQDLSSRKMSIRLTHLGHGLRMGGPCSMIESPFLQYPVRINFKYTTKG